MSIFLSSARYFVCDLLILECSWEHLVYEIYRALKDNYSAPKMINPSVLDCNNVRQIIHWSILTSSREKVVQGGIIQTSILPRTYILHQKNQKIKIL